MTTSIPSPAQRTVPAIEWSPPAGTRVISADDHVLEPPEFWSERLPAALPSAFRDRAPQWKDGSLFVDGEQLGFRKQFAGLQPLLEGREGVVKLEARLRDMDAEGIDAAFIFPQRTMGFFGLPDKQFVFHCVDAYNEWLAEWCTSAPNRLYGIAVLPTIYEPTRTREYISKLKQLGFRAMQIPSSPSNVAYNNPQLEPLWDAIEESGIPLSFHIGENPSGFEGPGAFGTLLTVGQQPFLKLWSWLTFSGVLERHPEMKVIFTEGGIAWIPSALYSADKLYREFETVLEPKLGQLPSYYWHRQCYATFMVDPRGLEQIEHIGAEKVFWSVDYPHAEGTLGSSRSLVKSFFEQLGETTAKAIVGGNISNLYDLPAG